MTEFIGFDFNKVFELNEDGKTKYSVRFFDVKNNAIAEHLRITMVYGSIPIFSFRIEYVLTNDKKRKIQAIETGMLGKIDKRWKLVLVENNYEEEE